MEKSDGQIREQTPSKMADLKTRLLSGGVLLAVAIVAIYWGGHIFNMFVMVVFFLCGYEWLRLCGVHNRPFRLLFGAVTMGLLGLSIFVYDNARFSAFMTDFAPFLAVTLGGVALMVNISLVRIVYHKRLVNILLAVFGIFYLWVCGYYIVLLGHQATSYVFVLVAVIAFIDTGAYFVGRALGGPKIWVALSPKKTWAGLLGAILGCAFVLWFPYFPLFTGGQTFGSVMGFLGLDWPVMLALAVILSVVAQSGDLLESWMKRRVNLKDSGCLIPGHGGFLDRMDGYLSVVIFIAIFRF